MKTKCYLDDLDEDKEKAPEENILIAEDDITKVFRDMMGKLRPMQRYILCQSFGYCSNEHDKMLTTKLKYEPVLVELGKQDEIGKNHIGFDDEEYLDDRYIRKERERMILRLRVLVEKQDYSEEEVLANLGPIMVEMEEEMEREYGL